VKPHIVGKSEFEYLPGAVALISPVAISLSSKHTIGNKQGGRHIDTPSSWPFHMLYIVAAL
jgi:hypothetical protein